MPPSDAVLIDVRKAVAALPEKGKKTRYSGPVKSDPHPESHIQGLAAYSDYFLLTHSDKSATAGRILVVDRRPEQRKLVAEFALPPLGEPSSPLFHAGGCQVMGDVLAVPSESGNNSSVVSFFDVSNPLAIREVHESLRIERRTRDAAAVGLTTITRGGKTAWVCAVYDSGSVDFYESPDLLGGVPFVALFSSPMKVKEKHHQALLLFTDRTNRVYAAGLNRGHFPSFDRLVLYEVDLVGQTMTPDPERPYSTGGGTRLRWGGTLEVANGHFVLHCSDRNYGERCTINTFEASVARARPVRRAAGARTSRARTPTGKRRTGQSLKRANRS